MRLLGSRERKKRKKKLVTRTGGGGWSVRSSPSRLAGERGEEGPAHLENSLVQCLLLLLHRLRHYSRLTVPLAPLASRPRLGPHRGHVTRRDAAIRWLRRALGPRPGRVPMLFRRALRLARVLRLTLPTRPDTPSGPCTSARPGPRVYTQPLHHLLGFPSAKYCLFVTLCCRCTEIGRAHV